MHPDNPFQQLAAELERWEEALEALHCIVAEDRPAANDVALADYYENAVTDALGWLREARESSQQAMGAATGGGGTPAQTVELLALTNAGVNRLARHYGSELAGWQRVTDLAQLGVRRGRQWQQWAEAIRLCLDSVAAALHSAQSAMTRAWQGIHATGGKALRPALICAN